MAEKQASGLCLHVCKCILPFHRFSLHSAVCFTVKKLTTDAAPLSLFLLFFFRLFDCVDGLVIARRKRGDQGK